MPNILGNTVVADLKLLKRVNRGWTDALYSKRQRAVPTFKEAIKIIMCNLLSFRHILELNCSNQGFF
jgi:hypothetical protein